MPVAVGSPPGLLDVKQTGTATASVCARRLLPWNYQCSHNENVNRGRAPGVGVEPDRTDAHVQTHSSGFESGTSCSQSGGRPTVSNSPLPCHTCIGPLSKPFMAIGIELRQGSSNRQQPWETVGFVTVSGTLAAWAYVAPWTRSHPPLGASIHYKSLSTRWCSLMCSRGGGQRADLTVRLEALAGVERDRR